MAADRRGVLIPLLIVAWIIFQPEPVRRPNIPLDSGPTLRDVIAEEQAHLYVLCNSSWDANVGRDGHSLNLTGLEPDRGYVWDGLPDIRIRARGQLEYALGDWAKVVLDDDSESDPLLKTPSPVPLYQNVTGYVRGHWKRSALQDEIPIPQLNLTEYASPGPFGQPGIARHFDRNITGHHGEITIHFDEQDFKPTAANHSTYNITEMDIELRVTDSDTSDEWEVQLRGLFYMDFGQAILTTTSSKYSGIFALPHMALTPNTFSAARSLLNESIATMIQRQIEGKTESMNPWHSRVEGALETPFDSPKCDMVIYLQQLTPIASTADSSAVLTFLERELRFPTGAVLPSAPDMHFSMLLFSPDCGYVLESTGPPDDFAQDGNHLTGPKIEVQYKHTRQHLFAFTFALAAQLFLLMRQMREASTPSTRSRISYFTIAMMSLGDGFTTMSFLLISLFVTGLWAQLVATGFLAFVSVSFFGMRFLMDIWQVQAPERERVARAEVEAESNRRQRFNEALARVRAERQAREEQEQSQANVPDARGATVHVNPSPPADIQPPATTHQPMPGSLPLPVTTLRAIDTGVMPVFMPSDQDGLEGIGAPTPTNTEAEVRARMPTFASFYIRFYIFLLICLFLSLNATSWPAPARRVYFTIIGLAYLSFWIPQIIRNVQRNCRHALNWEFVIGQSFLRLTPFVYFYAYKHNVLFAEPNLYGLATLVAWVWIQVVILTSQEVIGPRWFIRSDWAPPAYDYHPILREDEEGATLPIGLSQATDASTASSPIQERGSTSPIARRASLAKETKEKGKRIFDCAICMQDLEVAVVEEGAPAETGLGINLLARRAYMVTPCRHIFHSTCLSGWMKYRLQCPICRETLPPL